MVLNKYFNLQWLNEWMYRHVSIYDQYLLHSSSRGLYYISITPVEYPWQKGAEGKAYVYRYCTRNTVLAGTTNVGEIDFWNIMHRALLVFLGLLLSSWKYFETFSCHINKSCDAYLAMRILCSTSTVTPFVSIWHSWMEKVVWRLSMWAWCWWTQKRQSHTKVTDWNWDAKQFSFLLMNSFWVFIGSKSPKLLQSKRWIILLILIIH